MPFVAPAQAVGDLEWALTSPSYIDGSDVLGPVAFDPASIDAAHLVSEIGEAPRRVGLYFERLVRYWLEHVRRVDVIAAGRQIRRDGRTVGELDFVYRDEEGLVTHLEVAVKFYLHQPDRPGSHFPGPNVRDDFETKISRLFDHQLVIVDEGLEPIDRRRACVRGMSFGHPTVSAPATRPDRMATDHLRGIWLRVGELDRLAALSFAAGCVHEKPHWLGPMVAPQRSIDRLCDELRERFADDARPTMVDVLRGAAEEPVRLCVVADRWDSGFDQRAGR